MYLSRVKIDQKNRRKIKDLTHLGAYHGWVEQCFPDEFVKGIRTRKLWRIDTLGGEKYLLLLSEGQPDLKVLERYGAPGTAQTKSYDRLLQSVTLGAKYRFRVALNPVKSVASKGKTSRGTVVPEVTAEQQLQFLQRKQKAFGIKLLPGTCRIVERGMFPLYRYGSGKVRISVATFEGALEVVDKKAFLHALTCGVGKEKAYGCGLMTVIPE